MLKTRVQVVRSVQSLLKDLLDHFERRQLTYQEIDDSIVEEWRLENDALVPRIENSVEGTGKAMDFLHEHSDTLPEDHSETRAHIKALRETELFLTDLIVISKARIMKQITRPHPKLEAMATLNQRLLRRIQTARANLSKALCALTGDDPPPKNRPRP